MKDNIKQKNIFGDNLITSPIFKHMTKQRTQGFFVGLVTGIIASIIANLITGV